MKHWSPMDKAATGGYQKKTEVRCSFVLHASSAPALCCVPGSLPIHTWPLAKVSEQTDLEQR